MKNITQQKKILKAAKQKRIRERRTHFVTL